MINKIIESLFNFTNYIDRNTLQNNLNGVSFWVEFFKFSTLRYLIYKKYLKSIEGYLIPGQEYFLMRKAYELDNNAAIVEIGSYKGKSTACMAVGCLGTNKKIYAIDTFKGNDSDFFNFKSGKKYSVGFLNIFKRNLSRKGLLKYVNVQKGKSSDVVKEWKKPIDLLFIDASHQYTDVLKDFNSYYKFVKKGGLIIFHDVVPEFPGVFKVWNIAKKKLNKPNNFLSFGYGYK